MKSLFTRQIAVITEVLTFLSIMSGIISWMPLLRTSDNILMTSFWLYELFSLFELLFVLLFLDNLEIKLGSELNIPNKLFI